MLIFSNFFSNSSNLKNYSIIVDWRTKKTIFRFEQWKFCWSSKSWKTSSQFCGASIRFRSIWNTKAISKLTFNTAADIMNELLIHFALEQSHLDLKVVLQIHGLWIRFFFFFFFFTKIILLKFEKDELVFECLKSQQNEALIEIENVMTSKCFFLKNKITK